MTVLLIPACAPGEKKLNSKNELIRRPGIYTIGPQGVKLNIWLNNGIVYYDAEKNGQKLLQSTGRPSNAQRWFLCWDDKDNLWFDSSDIGMVVWRNDPQLGKYVEIPVAGQPDIVKAMPEVVFSSLFQGDQAKYRKFRAN
jgi:hypothetical protein